MSSSKSDKVALASLGQQGMEIVTGTGAGAAGPWVAIQMVTDTVFSAFTAKATTGTFTGVTFPAGQILYGAITAFTLTSGTCVAYKGALEN